MAAKKIEDYTEEELEKIALQIIGAVDYDIFKECMWEIDENGFDTIVDEIVGILVGSFE